MYSGYGDRQRNLQVDLDLVLSIEVKKIAGGLRSLPAFSLI